MSQGTTAVQPVSLRQTLPYARLIGADDLLVRRAMLDPRRCRPGDLFVARGAASRGMHQAAGEAVERGASGILTDSRLPDVAVPQCLVKDVGAALGRVCQALAGDPSRRVKVIGVTGATDKSVTAQLILSMLTVAGHRTAVIGALGAYDGLDHGTASGTTPEQPELAGWLARAAVNGATHAVTEVSTGALAQSRVAGIEFDVACVTDVRQVRRLRGNRSPRGRSATSRIFKQLAPEGVAVLNADDRRCAGYLSRMEGPVITVAIDSPAEVTATPIEASISEQTFLLISGNETIPVRTRLVGPKAVYGCLLATGVGMAYGIDLAAIVRGLELVHAVPGRLERVECGQPFAVIVDHARAPEELAERLSSLRRLTAGRVICVLGAHGGTSSTLRRRLGQTVGRWADSVIVTTDDARSDDPGIIASHIMSGIQDRSSASIELDRATAICAALERAREGDCVLIAGKGQRTWQIVGRDRYEFDDREVARAWLYETAATRELYRARA